MSTSLVFTPSEAVKQRLQLSQQYSTSWWGPLPLAALCTRVLRVNIFGIWGLFDVSSGHR